jgi:MazG family protein
MTEDSDSTPGERFQRLVDIMARLRAPGGCPWDREQTFDTIKQYLLEESYEVMDSIDARDWPAVAEELGDLLLQAVFFAQIASEQDLFRIDDSLEAINNKLIRRHPHVFGDGTARTPEQVKQRWDEIKVEEGKRKGEHAKALLAGVQRSLPALAEAQQISARAAGVGFDWDNADQVIDKLHEELGELASARSVGQAPPPARLLEDEIGDILFVIVNLARFLKVDPEQALRKTNAKFRSRFSYVERMLAAAGKSLSEASLEEMEALWQEAKGNL